MCLAYQSSSKAVDEIVDIMKSGKRDGKNIMSQLDDTTQVIYRMDVGENAHKIRSRGYSEPVNHINIEIQKMGQNGKYKSKWDFHIILNELGQIEETFELGVWTK